MNILFFSPRYSPDMGGVEKHVQHVAELLVQKKHKVTVITTCQNARLADHEWINGVEIWRAPISKKGISKVRIWLWLLLHIHLLFRAQVIHVHDVFYWLLPFRLPFFWKRVFMTFHGYEAPGPPNSRQVFWHQVAAALTKKNICIGGFHEKWYKVKPSLVSFGATDLQDQFKRPVRQHNSFIFAGRVAEDTGIMKYLEAIRILREEKSSSAYTLDVYGTGPLLKKCRDFVKQHHLPVTFFGQTENTSALFAQYDLAYVSGYLAILEALSHKTPVVATYHTELKKDYLQLTPFYEWITVAETSAAIAVASAKKHLVSKEASEWVQHQTWEKLTGLYLKLWK
jgi:glycosyltransferase involved in cell wall biosynthesis